VSAATGLALPCKFAEYRCLLLPQLSPCLTSVNTVNSKRMLKLHDACARRFMAFDRHMNLVLGDAEEYRKLPPKKGKSEDEVLPHSLLPFSSSAGVEDFTYTELPAQQSRSEVPNQPRARKEGSASAEPACSY
jgi:LSM domain